MKESEYVAVGKDREQAIENMMAFLRAHNGSRRTDPSEFVTVKQVRALDRNMWRILYTVPDRISKEAQERLDKSGCQTCENKGPGLGQCPDCPDEE